MAGTSTLTIDPVDEDHAGWYRAVVNDGSNQVNRALRSDLGRSVYRELAGRFVARRGRCRGVLGRRQRWQRGLQLRLAIQ